MILALVLALVGYLFCIVPVLPGQFITYAGVICLCFLSKEEIGAFWPVLFGILTVVATLLDFILPSIMARKFGGTKAGEIGAFIGSIIGAFIGLICGTFVLNGWCGLLAIILSPFVGAVIAELIHDRHHIKLALKSGLGSFLSFFVGVGIKLLVSLCMIIYILYVILAYIEWGSIWDFICNLFC